MSASLRASEAPAAQLRRVLKDHVRVARRCVGDTNDPTDDDLHDARRAIKRARATLRLLRPALDHDVFSAANIGLRDAARPLTQARDAKALLDALKRLGKRVDAPAARALLPALK